MSVIGEVFMDPSKLEDFSIGKLFSKTDRSKFGLQCIEVLSTSKKVLGDNQTSLIDKKWHSTVGAM